jgi:hypothetical protein
MPMLSIDRDLAVKLFLKACGNDLDVCASHPFEEFVQYAAFSHYTNIRGLLQLAMTSGNPKASEAAARRTVIAELVDIDVGGDAELIRTGTDIQRLAACDAYASNLSHEDVGDKCAEQLIRFFDDSSDEVRKKAAHAFFHADGDRILQLEPMIKTFIESRAFESHPLGLMHSLSESNVKLPEIACRAVERILDSIEKHSSQGAIEAASSSATVLIRTYEQSVDIEIRKRCLDLIDRMEQLGLFGIESELEKIDR